MYLLSVQVKNRHLNPKAACVKKREEEKAVLRIGSCSTPNPLTPTADGTFEFEGLSGEISSTLPVAPPTSTGSMPSSSNHSRSISPTTAYYSTSAGSPFQSSTTSPGNSFTYSIPYNPSPPPLTPTDKIPRVKSETHMKRKTNGNVSPTLRKAKGGGRVLSPVVGGGNANSNLEK